VVVFVVLAESLPVPVTMNVYDPAVVLEFVGWVEPPPPLPPPQAAKVLRITIEISATSMDRQLRRLDGIPRNTSRPRTVAPPASLHPFSFLDEQRREQRRDRRDVYLLVMRLLQSSTSEANAPHREVVPNSRQALTARSHGYQRVVDPASLFQNRTTVGLRTTRQRRLYHDCPVWPCTHALYPCIRRPPPRKHQRLLA